MCLNITIIKIKSCFCKHKLQIIIHRARRFKPKNVVSQKWIPSHLDDIVADFHLLYTRSCKSSWMDKINFNVFQFDVPVQSIFTWMDEIEVE